MSKNSRIILIIIVLVLVIGIAIALARHSNAPATNVDGTGNVTEPTALPPAPTGSSTPAAATTHTVEIKNDVYTPSKFTIKQGDTVIFKNVGSQPQWPASAVHPTHLVYPEFDPKAAIAPGSSWSFTFDKVGVWRWHDHIHAQINGVITVEE